MKDPLEEIDRFVQAHSPDAVITNVGDGVRVMTHRDEARPVCDFCGEVPSITKYPARDIEVDRYQLAPDLVDSFSSIGEWGACAGCQELIDSDQRKALAHRAFIIMKRRHFTDMSPSEYDGVLRGIIRHAHEKFFEARI